MRFIDGNNDWELTGDHGELMEEFKIYYRLAPTYCR
jgi:hypothetical protein